MKSSRAVLTAVVVIIVAVAGWWMFRRGGAEHIDLLSQFDSAEQRGGTFTVIDATLAGDTKKAIAAPPNGRLTFRIRVPDLSRLRVSSDPAARWPLGLRLRRQRLRTQRC